MDRDDDQRAELPPEVMERIRARVESWPPPTPEQLAIVGHAFRPSDLPADSA